jgi:hypothetical protein
MAGAAIKLLRMPKQTKQWTYWGASHSAAVGIVALIAAIAILAQGQLVGLAILAFALFFAGMTLRSWRRGQL